MTLLPVEHHAKVRLFRHQRTLMDAYHTHRQLGAVMDAKDGAGTLRETLPQAMLHQRLCPRGVLLGALENEGHIIAQFLLVVF